MTVTVFYDLLAKPDRADELLALLQAGRDIGLNVAGCEGYEVLQAEDDPHRLMMVERWTSPDAHMDHFQKNVVATGVLDQAVALLVEPPRQPLYYLTR